MNTWYPIKITAHIRTYAFGERLIPELLGKRGVPAGRVAETWEISDYRDTTGTVIGGALAGRTLHQLIEEYPDEVVGAGWRGPHFPLLEKFLDASHMLPVHLHADDETARRKYQEPNGKTEAWHILWAAPGATILAGVRPDLSRDQLFAAFKAQAYDKVLFRYPIQPGDTVYVPGGVLHSFGPDTLIFEVQQTSDLAQNVMPVDLFGNPLSEEQWDANINAVLDELRTDYQPRPNPGLALPSEGENRYMVGCAGPHFALERWTLRAPHLERLDGRRCRTLSNVGSPVRLDYMAGTDLLARGESCILPAALGEVTITPVESGEIIEIPHTLEAEAERPDAHREAEANPVGSLIVCYVPDLHADIVTRLREAGHSIEAIRALGEVLP
ncbi:MAG TPA: class I mannose-6-phosphate isomerase [Chloroflexota bacterium]|nr:class I mannose-6-phosphate isomerase [Chloroflexota bacterium]